MEVLDARKPTAAVASQLRGAALSLIEAVAHRAITSCALPTQAPFRFRDRVVPATVWAFRVTHLCGRVFARLAARVGVLASLIGPIVPLASHVVTSFLLAKILPSDLQRRSVND
jgi:uncharacterized membrane protein